MYLWGKWVFVGDMYLKDNEWLVLIIARAYRLSRTVLLRGVITPRLDSKHTHYRYQLPNIR
jgi:hypothetical protein